MIKDSDWEQLCIMSSARNLIIASSMFSWWAAFAYQRSGIVIAPKSWFVDTSPGCCFSLSVERAASGVWFCVNSLFADVVSCADKVKI